MFGVEKKRCGVLAFMTTLLGVFPAAHAAFAADIALDLTRAVVVVRDSAPLVEKTAAAVLIEETAKRTGSTWKSVQEWPETGWSIAILSGRPRELYGRAVPPSALTTQAEGYGIATDTSNPNHPVLWIDGADPRGALFGVGRVLRNLDCSGGQVHLHSNLNLTSAPICPIRGHQLGYRATANSYDAWTPAQFEQYIRELAIFGSNSIEGIPFQDTRPTINPYPHSKMNVDLSRICEKYAQDYWIWAPADFDLNDSAHRAKALKEHEELFRACPELTGIFMAGGDPGDNPAELVIPYLKDLAKILAPTHPKAKIWLSMQSYSGSQQDYVYRWIERERPKWLGGLVAGPSSPPLADVRARLPKQYQLRDYPDVTHSVRCQFGVPWWDPAYALTEGRECVNPRPIFFSRVIRDTAAFTNGFISYSDGVHDDVNKIVWSSLAWDRDADINTVLTEYCRYFFGQEAADSAAAGLFAFERDWEGSLASNGGVDATFALWHSLEEKSPNLRSNWRWQMCLLRAYYDLYTRQRLIYESKLEDNANASLLSAAKVGSDRAISSALNQLSEATEKPIRSDLSAAVKRLCDDLNKSIGLQTSVEKYHASGLERGCVLDFLDYPLNNRWWLEDELAKVKTMGTEAEKIVRLQTIANWEHPGMGSFYDDIGNVAKSPHEVRNEKLAAPLLDVDNAPTPGFMFWVDKDPNARVRQSWISDGGWTTVLKYPALDPQADYVVKTGGLGDCYLRANGIRIAPTKDGKKMGDIKAFPIPRGLYREGSITITLDPTFEPNLNWRVQSRLMEIWLIKK